MYKAILNKIKCLQDKVKTADDLNKPNLILVCRQEDNKFKIVEWYYNTLNHKAYQENYIVDDYKKALEKYASDSVKVIVDDLPINDD